MSLLAGFCWPGQPGWLGTKRSHGPRWSKGTALAGPEGREVKPYEEIPSHPFPPVGAARSPVPLCCRPLLPAPPPRSDHLPPGRRAASEIKWLMAAGRAALHAARRKWGFLRSAALLQPPNAASFCVRPALTWNAMREGKRQAAGATLALLH